MAAARWVNKDKILARLRALPPAVTDAVRDELKVQVDGLAEAMRRAAPVGKTGKLRKSILVRPGSRPISYIVQAGGVLTTVKIRSRASDGGRGKRKGVSDRDFSRALQSGGNRGEFDYARGVEFGHMTPAGGHVSANPFFYPIYRSRKKAIQAALRRAARNAAKKTFAGGA